MYIKVIVFSAACMSLLIPASGTSLLAAAAAAGTIKGAILGAGIKGLLSKGSETVIVNADSGEVIETVPAQNFVYHPAQVHYTPVHQIPVSNPMSSLVNCISGIFSTITNSISAKAQAVGSLLNVFKRPQQVIILVPNNTTTTTTTKKPLIEVIVNKEHERLVPVAVPVSVVDYYKK